MIEDRLSTSKFMEVLKLRLYAQRENAEGKPRILLHGQHVFQPQTYG